MDYLTPQEVIKALAEGKGLDVFHLNGNLVDEGPFKITDNGMFNDRGKNLIISFVQYLYKIHKEPHWSDKLDGTQPMLVRSNRTNTLYLIDHLSVNGKSLKSSINTTSIDLRAAVPLKYGELLKYAFNAPDAPQPPLPYPTRKENHENLTRNI